MGAALESGYGVEANMDADGVGGGGSRICVGWYGGDRWGGVKRV